ncbi:MAG: hypothetical protein MUP17_00690 [candidate division Zixibacteria bacterium]|nr:hypothetical protein [candidate division Zixibacteria bacterium]
MSVNEFLQELLDSQKLSGGELDAIAQNRDEIKAVLTTKFGNEPKIWEAGSKAKGTMIKESYDLDLVCYFPRDCGRDIKEIYEDVEGVLQAKYVIERKTSALRILRLDNNKNAIYSHIDVVPGRFIDEKEEDAFLYISQGEKDWIQTNLDVHIEHVRKSGCSELIKLVKLWKIRNLVQLKTFILELLVVEFLKGSRTKDNLESSFKKVLESLRDDISDMRLEDPANSNNDVCNNWSKSERLRISFEAKESLALIGGENANDTEKWKQVFKEKSIEASSASPLVIKDPAKHWCSP